MAKHNRRGATRKSVRKQREAIDWQKGFRFTFVMLFLFGLVSAAVYLQRDDTFPILHVTVEGDLLHTDKNTLIKAVTPYVTGSFFSVDADRIQQAGEALPWVKQIQVKRAWPDSVHLVVEEQHAISRWGDNALLNNNGEIFSPATTTFPAGLATLTGPKGANKMMAKRYVDIQRQVSKLGLKVTQIKMDQRRAWQVDFSDGLKVMLGRANSEQRLQRFITVFNAGLQRYQADIATIDMRYTNGLAVVWKQGQKPNFNGTV